MCNGGTKLRRAWGRLVLWMIQPALEESGRAAVELSSGGQTYQAGIGVTTDGRIYRAGIDLASSQAKPSHAIVGISARRSPDGEWVVGVGPVSGQMSESTTASIATAVAAMVVSRERASSSCIHKKRIPASVNVVGT